MRRTPPRTAGLILTGAKAGALGALLALVVGIGVTAQGVPTERPDPVADDYSAEISEAMTEHECNSTGFGPDVIPASALVRTGSGQVKQVTFDKGWAIHRGDVAGSLIAVCLADPGR